MALRDNGRTSGRPATGNRGTRNYIVATLWALVVVVAALGASQAQSVFREGGWEVEGHPSFQVAESLSDGFVGRGASSISLAITDDRYEAGSPEFEARIWTVVEDVVSTKSLEVTSRVGWLDGGSATEKFLGSDNRTVLSLIGSELGPSDAPIVLTEAQAALDAEYVEDGLHPVLLSVDSFWGQINQASLQGLAHAEVIALPLILIVLLLLYRSVVATVVSVTMVVPSIVVTLGLLFVIGQFLDLSSFTLNAVTMLGLGVCIDYSLFIVRRFQQELAAGRTRAEALVITRRTAGRTVIASGLTVAVALVMLLLVDLTIIRSLALGGIIVVLASVATCTTLLPALLGILGQRVNWGRIPWPQRFSRSQDGSSRLAKTVTRRPAAFLISGTLILLALAIPATQLTTFTPDVRIVGEEKSVRQGYDRVAKAFSIGSTSPIQVLIESETGSIDDLDSAQVRSFVDDLQGVDGVEEVVTTLPAMAAASPQDPLALADPAARSMLPPSEQKVLGSYISESGDRLLIEVRLSGWAAGDEAQAALAGVQNLTEQEPIDGATIGVGGETAQGVASNQQIAQVLPWVLLTMMVVIFLLLAITFKSVVISVVAVIFNLLSVGGAYGVMVLVFQNGIGADLLGYTVTGYVQNFVPILLLALLFSLATDYQVFLISRIKEMRDAGVENRSSISQGMTVTAPLITGAAFLMLVVFGAFSFTGIVPIQQLGFGLAVGIFLDATLVRILLVPSALTLLGKAAWWPQSKAKQPPPPPGRFLRPAKGAIRRSRSPVQRVDQPNFGKLMPWE